MIASATSVFESLCSHARETAVLESVQALLEWDERTKMPPAAGEYRAEQMAYLSGLIHKRHTDPQLGAWLSDLMACSLASDPHSDTGATIWQSHRDYEKRIKLPQALVEELTRATILGQQAWVKARHDNDFPSFQPFLQQILALKRQQAEALGYVGHPYDALLDDYEPGATTAQVAEVLANLREQLAPFVAAIMASGRTAPKSILTRQFPVAAQETFGCQVASKIGFSFERGRLDVTHHPFCTGMGPHDCRITTRYDEHFFPTSLFGTLHEAGHGIYDQGLRTDQYGLPPGMFVSLGIHESQSRMWENFVGRSRAFWQYFYPSAQRAFPAALGQVPLDDFFFAINGVSPSLIRVEADEATYNLHIIIRFELEQALLTGDLPIADLPSAWRDKYREYLGIEPPNDADGVLQDVHWSAGLFGYFPTYSLGNLYAAQFFQTADEELGGLEAQFVRGEFEPLRIWLEQNIHRRGKCHTAPELIELITGRALGPEPLMNHLRTKLAPLYGLA